MSPSRYAVVLTHASSHAIRAEHVLRQAGLETRLMPVPRHLSSDCGVCVQIRAEDTAQAEEVLRKNRVPYDRVEAL